MIQGLCNPRAYQHEVSNIRIIETHISWVLLTGKIAYKIKKPVNFGFLDFSTLEKRRFFCEEELRLNRRLAANLYLDVVPVTGDPDLPEMDGTGDAIEYAVRMRQFPEGKILSELAETGELDHDHIDQIVDAVAEFHDRIERAADTSVYGDSGIIKKWFEENFDHIGQHLTDPAKLSRLRAVQNWGHTEWLRRKELMRLRKQQGFVRECHGDLHLGNMTVIDGKVTLFDCIEFNPLLRWIDVISEVAFLVMDLLQSGHEELGYRFLNRYMYHTGDYAGLVLLPYYLVYRALVRAKVSLLRFEQQSSKDTGDAISLEYDRYLSQAEKFTRIGPPLLIITHGFSGSGKSVLSSQLAENIGAIHIRSDIERKRLFGYRATEQTGSGIDSGLYSSETSRKTYRRLAELARSVILSGFPVVIDAAFLKSQQRALFRETAASLSARFIIIDFQASDDTLRRRILNRQLRYNDPSEATVDVLRHQQQTAESLTDSERKEVISVNTEDSDAAKNLLEAFDS
ncbi:MAG: bifunctional aminoglycoside phosphotransferase/ATP-binding protein [Gammaproteobacteria bacterium]